MLPLIKHLDLGTKFKYLFIPKVRYGMPQSSLLYATMSKHKALEQNPLERNSMRLLAVKSISRSDVIVSSAHLCAFACL
jgi:hypothetical protein